MLKGLRKNNKKGFTLVELIVVLVILAILAALLIPALTGYIDKAKEKQLVAETRQIVMATQTLLDEAYAVKTSTDTISFETGDRPSAEKSKFKIYQTDIKGLSEVKTLTLLAAGAIVSNEGDVVVTVDATNGSKIAKVVYKNHGKTCTYDATADVAYTVE